MKKKINSILSYYENHLIQFEGDKNYYYFDIKKLKGMEIEGELVKKRVRTWFV